jgi:hypothetical protein
MNTPDFTSSPAHTRAAGFGRPHARRGFHRIFTAAEKLVELLATVLSPLASRKPAPGVPFGEIASSTCTKSGHPPVDDLHSIENKSDKSALFSLTQKLKRVQQDRSLTVS